MRIFEKLVVAYFFGPLCMSKANSSLSLHRRPMWHKSR